MIKLIAVDMDGTFLDDQKKYDKRLFAAQLQQLAKQEIKFVVASGNQYLHLKNYFSDFLDKVTFVCENGALIVEKNQIIYERCLASNLVNWIVETLLTNEEIALDRLILSGKNSSYILQNTKEEFLNSGRFFYHNLQLVESLYNLPDQIYKVTINFTTEKKAESLAILHGAFDEQATILTSGFKAVDVVAQKVGKETALSHLQRTWSITDNELACFGDNLNDLGMIKKAAYGFVMENGKEELKNYAYKVIGTNNKNAVLREIDQIIKGRMHRKSSPTI